MSAEDWGIDAPEQTFWFNTQTGLVEEGPQSLPSDRLGPFRTSEEAARALQIIQDRAREWAMEESNESDE